MKWSLFALCIGFCIDLLIGDPHGLPHPVAAIGHLISLLERLFRRLFPKTPGGERAAGACIWILTALIAAALPALLLWGCGWRAMRGTTGCCTRRTISATRSGRSNWRTSRVRGG